MTCNYCKKSFNRKIDRRRTNLYCSVACSNKSRIRINPEKEERWCAKCKAYKKATLFRPGDKPYCRSCDNFYAQRWYIANREKALMIRKRGHLKRTYGITIEEYESLAKHGCNICKNGHGKRKLSVDHDHKTLVVRGVLCENCNRGIGLFKDNPLLLKRAAKYLS